MDWIEPILNWFAKHTDTAAGVGGTLVAVILVKIGAAIWRAAGASPEMGKMATSILQAITSTSDKAWNFTPDGMRLLTPGMVIDLDRKDRLANLKVGDVEHVETLWLTKWERAAVLDAVLTVRQRLQKNHEQEMQQRAINALTSVRTTPGGK